MEQINQNLKFLFPRMFGGGQADLVLLEEDILTAGMAIEDDCLETMSIQSLSEGEVDGCCDINICFYLTLRLFAYLTR